MVWLRNFHVAGTDDKELENRAGAQLSVLFPILEADLAGQNGSRQADILAHIGWAHWLNFHIASKDVPSSAEENFRRALSIDSRNVYANAMLGNWLLQTGGQLTEAKQHFDLAVQSGMDRPFVRGLQLGAMIYSDDAQTRAELTRVANEMRKNGEKISESDCGRIISTNYSLAVNDEARIVPVLAALPPDEAWATYLWLADRSDDPVQPVEQKFIKAKIKEISGNNAEALTIYRSLQTELRGTDFTWADQVTDAIRNLKHKQ